MSKANFATQDRVAPLHGKGPWRIAGVIALCAVLGLAFVGYLTPEMRIQWANFVALCGF